MKTARRFLTALLVGAGLTFVSGPWRPAQAEIVFNAELVNDTCIGASTNYDLPLMDISNVSFVANYSSTTAAAKTFTDGRKSTATITVSLNSDLAARVSTATIDVQSASTTTLRGQSVTLNGVRYQGGAGGEWTPVLTATGNAVALAAAIQAGGVWTTVVSSTRITITSISSGTYINGWTIATTSSANFVLNGGGLISVNPIGGRDSARLAVNGIFFVNGTDWTSGSTSSATAKAISDALMANSTIAANIVSTWTAGGIVAATATATGVNAYALFTSTNNALRLNGSASNTTDTFLNGAASLVATATDKITIYGHGYGTGLDVLYTTSPATSGLGGLTNGTTYFVIKTNDGVIQLATTKALAAAGTAIDISTNSATGGGTYTLTPVAFTGSASFKWQGSNNSTFVDLSVSSVTFSGASTSSAWDFGTLPYKTLRLKYTTPTTGCGQIQATGTGRR